MRSRPPGPQVHKEEFDNGYGMSVVIGAYAPGEFNVAVFRVDTGALVYNTSVTHDTIRCDTYEELITIREQIKALRHINACQHCGMQLGIHAEQHCLKNPANLTPEERYGRDDESSPFFTG